MDVFAGQRALGQELRVTGTRHGYPLPLLETPSLHASLLTVSCFRLSVVRKLLCFVESCKRHGALLLPLLI
ncbi:hypothetical protein [Paracoccus marinus]|uniref:hypothetical protein n=1 Tax=Paracoccus marinus TaxID=288426 RepID=UPI00103C41F9|nr:hypothetical protein [Paracoccus marinus]